MISPDGEPLFPSIDEDRVLPRWMLSPAGLAFVEKYMTDDGKWNKTACDVLAKAIEFRDAKPI